MIWSQRSTVTSRVDGHGGVGARWRHHQHYLHVVSLDGFVVVESVRNIQFLRELLGPLLVEVTDHGEPSPFGLGDDSAPLASHPQSDNSKPYVRLSHCEPPAASATRSFVADELRSPDAVILPAQRPSSTRFSPLQA